jgi:hypothetical protein
MHLSPRVQDDFVRLERGEARALCEVIALRIGEIASNGTWAFRKARS